MDFDPAVSSSALAKTFYMYMVRGAPEECRRTPPHPNPSIPCLPSSSPLLPSLTSATMIPDLCSSVTTNNSPTPTLNSMEPTPTPPQQPGNRTSRLPVAETRAAAGMGQERGRTEKRGETGREEGRKEQPAVARREGKGRGRVRGGGRKGGRRKQHISHTPCHRGRRRSRRPTPLCYAMPHHYNNGLS